MTFIAEWEKETDAQIVQVEAYSCREADREYYTLDISYRLHNNAPWWEGPDELDLSADELDALIAVLQKLRNSL